MANLPLQEGYSFDDLLLLPSFSNVLPKDVTVNTRLTRRISLSIPIVSAAMDTVTEAETAISMAREGGLGFIHRNLDIKTQAMEVDKVKKSESGMIVDPVTIHPDQKVAEVLTLMEQYRISGVPVVQGGQLVGIVTNRDLRFETDMDKKVSEVMTKDRLVTVTEGISLEESKKLLHKHRIEKLLVVDKKGRLTGLITIKDIEKIKKFPNACKDSLGRSAGRRGGGRRAGHGGARRGPAQGGGGHHPDRHLPRAFQECDRCGQAPETARSRRSR